ncbi:MAG: hypothetical protein HYY40_11050 [Bacteroidetes bacterium]|nr:hypothetical protein [Bacteroidota bacterium]
MPDSLTALAAASGFCPGANYPLRFCGCLRECDPHLDTAFRYLFRFYKL